MRRSNIISLSLVTVVLTLLCLFAVDAAEPTDENSTDSIGATYDIVNQMVEKINYFGIFKVGQLPNFEVLYV